MIANIVFSLPIDTSFDYLVPKELEKSITKWSRVRVPFRNTQALGYVVGFSSKSRIKELKSISSLLDKQPILDVPSFRLAEHIAANYFCSLGEAIELMLPSLLRKGRQVELVSGIKYQVSSNKTKGEVILLHDLADKRWQFLEEKIEKEINKGRGIIILSPEIHLCLAAKSLIEKKFKQEVALLHSKNTDKEELDEWLKVKNGKINIVIGTSSAIFAPLKNLGLIIIDEEETQVYKQEQSPFYNAKDIALLRAKKNKADLILVSSAPSLESYYLAERAKFRLIRLEPEKKPEICVQIVDIYEERYRQKKRDIILSNILENNINKALVENKKVMLFLNRVGFATYARCASCGFMLKCSHCSKNLVFVYSAKQLICRSCNFKMLPPEVCPQCNLSYIRYSGLGTEKLESEMHRLFPSAKILRYDRLEDNADFKRQPFDILITTQVILKDLPEVKDIGLLGVISLDMSLSRPDFRAAEKAFGILSRLVSLVRGTVVIQTSLTNHYLIMPLIHNDYVLFYKEELKQRKELLFPPFSALVLVTLRGRIQEKAESAAQSLFNYLKEKNKNNKNGILVSNPNANVPLKLRNNFRYNILLKSQSKKTLINFINKYLRVFKKSGIIITVDIDPL